MGAPDVAVDSPRGQRTATEAPLRILFLHPKTLVDSWPVPVDTLGEIVKFPSATYPVLAAAIKGLTVEIRMLDGYVGRIPFHDYKTELAWPDLIAISCMSPLKALDTELTIKLARAINPRVRIVVGGNHATAWPERWLASGVDFVVSGEGEIAFRSLVEHLIAGADSFAAAPNLFWSHMGVVQRPTVKAAPVDLRSAPPPDWSAFDLRRYGLGMSSGLAAAIEISRGCPHRCDFCNINTFWSHKQRYKPVDQVITEMRALKANGVGEFIFTDDNFGGDERHTVRLLTAMISNNLGMRFGCFLRGDTVYRNPGFARLAFEAGMRFCMMGIETLDPAWLKAHRKGVRASDAREMYPKVYEALRREGIFVVGLFILAPSPEPTSRVAPTGVVCDYQFTADLVALKGSALYQAHASRNTVSKDMFYHDWNLSSIVVEGGAEQKSQKSFIDTLRENLSPFALGQIFAGSPIARRFRLRPIGILLERVLCTRLDDVRRYRVAKSSRLTMQEKQDYAVNSVLDFGNVARLMKSKHWLAPLGLRTGLWTSPPPRGEGSESVCQPLRSPSLEESLS
jgi:anaerobic magnesium-protoporphyrin IX monomethyl ester cyclase